MVTNSQNKWWSRGATLLVWAGAAASVAWWGLRLSVTAASVPAGAPTVTAGGELAVDAAAVSRVLGAGVATTTAPAAPTAASRYALLGVVADAVQLGAALIAVDGKPARAYRVGSSLDTNLILQAVEPRRARVGPAGGQASFVLELPPVKTGTESSKEHEPSKN
jgi:general secretion pathway protein C